VDIINITDHRDDVQSLLNESDTYMQSLYPDESNHMVSLSNLLNEHTNLIGVMIGDELAGIGAVKHIKADETYGEIKRVFVLEKHRGKGLSKVIMQRLHQRLLEAGIVTAKLETGVYQPEAIGLYRALGYIKCGPFGDYQTDPLSVFMVKKLV